MDNRLQLTKTCANCGTQKPLSAFLQLDAEKGAIYGNICNACRGTLPKIKKESAVEDTGEHGSPPALELTIDNRAKVKTELDQKAEKEVREEAKEEAKKKREKEGETKESETETKDKERRKDFVEQRKSYLDYTSKKPDQTNATTTAAVVTAAQARETIFNVQHGNEQTVSTQKQVASTAENQFIAAEGELKERSINTSQGQYLDPGQAGMLKYQGIGFQTLKSFLGESAHFRTLEQKAGKHPGTTATEQKNSTPQTTAEKKEVLVDYIRTNFKAR